VSFNTSAGQLHLNGPQLTTIINETQHAIGRMRQLDSQVMSLSGDIARFSQSTSGQILQRRLGVWSQEFADITRKLEELNTRAMNVRNVLIATGQGASDAAGGNTG